MNVSLIDPVREPRVPRQFRRFVRQPARRTRSFGAQTVLHGIDLDIPAGQFVAIVGRSGCGKSTLLRLLAGLDQPTGGQIEIDGRASGWRDTVRLMFQEPRLLPWQRVAANVEVGLSHRRAGEDRRRLAIETLAQVGLEDRAKEWPAVLSGRPEAARGAGAGAGEPSAASWRSTNRLGRWTR